MSKTVDYTFIAEIDTSQILTELDEVEKRINKLVKKGKKLKKLGKLLPNIKIKNVYLGI